MVDEKVPVQMGHLMLDHPAGELVESLGHLLEVLVEVLDGDAFRPDDVAIDVRDAETAFRIFSLLPALRDDFRIDHDPDEILEIRVDVNHVPAIDDQQPLAHSHLGSGKSAAFGLLQGFLHVGDKPDDVFPFFGVDRFGDFPEHLRAVKIDWQYHFSLFFTRSR